MQLLLPSFNRDDEKLFYRENLCIPRHAVIDVLKLAHDRRLVGHF